MTGEMIDNPKNARVKRAAALVRKKDRMNAQRFLVEGPQAVRELVQFAPETVDALYATTGTEHWQRELDGLASDQGVSITRVTPDVLAAMAETVHPQGVIAVARMQQFDLAEVLAQAKLVAILHEVRDPGNAGAVLRAADAAGADAVIFAGDSIDPWHPKVVRATTGSLFHLPTLVHADLSAVIAAASEAGIHTIAADVRGDDLNDTDAALGGRCAWVFGNEAHGLAPENRDRCDRVMRLPIFGAAESLNLATAASVCLYTTAFAQRRAGVAG